MDTLLIYLANASGLPQAVDDGSHPLPVTNSVAPINTLPGITRQAISINTIGDNVIVPAVGGQTARMFSLVLSVAAALTALTIKGSGGGTFTVFNTLAAGAVINFPYRQVPYFSPSLGSGISINLSAAVQVNGTIEFNQS